MGDRMISVEDFWVVVKIVITIVVGMAAATSEAVTQHLLRQIRKPAPKTIKACDQAHKINTALTYREIQNYILPLILQNGQNGF